MRRVHLTQIHSNQNNRFSFIIETKNVIYFIFFLFIFGQSALFSSIMNLCNKLDGGQLNKGYSRVENCAKNVRLNKLRPGKKWSDAFWWHLIHKDLDGWKRIFIYLWWKILSIFIELGFLFGSKAINPVAIWQDFHNLDQFQNIVRRWWLDFQKKIAKWNYTPFQHVRIEKRKCKIVEWFFSTKFKFFLS